MATFAVAYNKDTIVSENGVAENEVMSMKDQHVRDVEIANIYDQDASNMGFTGYEDQVPFSMDATAMSVQVPSHMNSHGEQNHGVAGLEVTTVEDLSASILEVDTKENQFFSHAGNLNSDYHIMSNLEIMSSEFHDMEPAGGSGPIKQRRKKSMVWEHFTLESESDGSIRARCMKCNRTFAYSTGSKLSGTSHLKRHISMGSCLKNVGKPRVKRRKISPGDASTSTVLATSDDGTPITPATNELALSNPHVTDGASLLSPTDGVSLPSPTVTDAGTVDIINRRQRRKFSNFNIAFDQDRSTQDLVNMIILHDYPLHMVEHSAFKTFVQNLQPGFKIADFITVESECLAAHQKEKPKILHILETIPGRICLSIDLYMSTQSLGYICLTGHFIGSDWKPCKRVLNSIIVSFPHSGIAHADAISVCLNEWNIANRLLSITLHDYPSSDMVSAYLRDQYSKGNIFGQNGQIFIVRCFPQILSTIAQDGFESIHDVVYKVRDSVKYVKACSERAEKFAKLVQELQITTSKSLCLDFQNQWDTTYFMLVAAAEYKDAFSHLEKCDSNYNDAPSADEWIKVETLCRYLKVLHDGAKLFTGVQVPTANMYFHVAWKIQFELIYAASANNPSTASITKPMHEKFDKYWADCNLVLAMAVLLDPRYKKKLIEFTYSKIYGDHAEQFVKEIDDYIHDLYAEYVAQPLPLTPAYEEQNPLDIDVKECDTLLISDDGLLDFDVYISELSNSQQTKSELDQYLDDPLVPRYQNFNILSWWKENKVKLPTLSNMARDLLSIPFNTVGPESIFCNKERVLDSYRSSLKPETVEAVFCARNWFQLQPETEMVQTSDALAKVER